MRLRTCTKVNIGLNIIRKRPDGYCDLETLFVPYWGLGDELSVEPAEDLSIDIRRDGGVDWDPMTDLTVRAWQLLKADFPSLPAVSIRLVKGAPVGAGLGGGSADGAFMLRALNQIGGLGLSDAALAGYAAKLGSDCSFFIYCQPMFGSGRGEILEPFDIDLSAYDLRVEIPLDSSSGLPIAVSTREAFGSIVPRELREVPLREALHKPIDQWKGIVVNDFEPTLFRLHPEIPAMIEDFYSRGAAYAAMSGSGAAVFGLFRK
jgi:4-diphosphocytidyl-2-C-methyl-D-erythritol kinase